MKIKKVIDRFAKVAPNSVELRRVARALGHELLMGRRDILEGFRTEITQVPISEASYEAGYVNGLLDVTVEVENSLHEAADRDVIHQVVQRDEYRKVLLVLAGGPETPENLAIWSGDDRTTLSRVLNELRQWGLVQCYAGAMTDTWTRPHRLTAQGRKIVGKFSSELSPEVSRGIGIAVNLFRHLLTHPSSPATALEEIAVAELKNPTAAAEAVRVWASESMRARLVDTLEAVSVAGNPAVQVTDTVSPRNHALWANLPYVMTQLKEREHALMPVYVRTSNVDWGAWAYALRSGDMAESSRTIVKGDIVSNAVLPPSDEKFTLVYDNLDSISEDAKEPTMQAFQQQAERKFVVTSAEDTIPDGYIQLRLAP